MSVKAAPIEALPNGTWRVLGSAPLSKVSEAIGHSLPDEKHDTFAGFVFSSLGSIPDEGDTPEFTYGPIRVKVVAMREHRLEEALIVPSC
jgi:putative hemolysin